MIPITCAVMQFVVKKDKTQIRSTRSSRSPYPARRSAEDLGPIRGVPDAPASGVGGHADAAQGGDGEHVSGER